MSEMIKDMFMVRNILQVLNPLSIHITFTAIVGRTHEKPKYGKNGHFLELWVELLGIG